MAIPGQVISVGKMITPGGAQGPAGQIQNLPPIADNTQNGLLRKVSGLTTDFIDGSNNCRSLASLNTFVTKTTTYTLTVADSGKYIICSGGSWTLTLPTPVIGLNYRLRNDMGISGVTGTITIVQTGAATIDGQASLAFLPQQECTLITDGTNWRTYGLKREVILGTNDITAATGGQVLLPVGYRYFELEFNGFRPVASDTLRGILSSNGGSSWIQDANYYHGTFYPSSTAAAAFGQSEAVAYFNILPTQNAGTAYSSGKLVLYPGSVTASNNPTWHVEAWARTGGQDYAWLGGGVYNSYILANALYFYPSAQGNMQVYVTVKGVV